MGPISNDISIGLDGNYQQNKIDSNNGWNFKLIIIGINFKGCYCCFTWNYYSIKFIAIMGGIKVLNSNNGCNFKWY